MNPSCEATFHTLGRGRLYSIDFREAQRRSGTKVVTFRNKTHPVERFWLCEKCADAFTLQVNHAGELHMVPLAAGKLPAAAAKAPIRRSATAS